MILHVAELDKFMPPFVRLVNEEFEGEEHEFWFIDPLGNGTEDLPGRIYVCGGGFKGTLSGGLRLIKQLHNARKVMLHGLFSINVLVILFLCPWVLHKCYWVIWGGDLYQYTNVRTSIPSKLREILRRFIIGRVGHLVTYIKGDVELARQWYGATGTHHECIMYLSNVVNPGAMAETNPRSGKGGLNILLGNSADPSNNHIQALERLLAYKDQDIKIFVPLSYGDRNHARSVIAQGHEWFGEKFVPMTDFMPFEQYLEFLKSLDIAIFNHQRQQAMGNIVTLLGMGKKVFIRSDFSHGRFLTGLGIKLDDVEQLALEPADAEDAKMNARIVFSYFSKATLIKQLSEIFEA